MGACVLRYCIVAHLEKWSKISTNFPRKDRDFRASFFGVEFWGEYRTALIVWERSRKSTKRKEGALHPTTVCVESRIQAGMQCP